MSELVRSSLWQHGMTDSHFHSSAMTRNGIDVPAVLEMLAANGMGMLVDVAIQPEDTMVAGAGELPYPRLFRTCGLHPSMAGRADWQDAIALTEAQISTGRFAALGETGLDWYRLYAPRERQLEVFEAQLSLARQTGHPVIVHNREADQDCLEMIRRAALPQGGIMHCFSSTPEWIAPFLDAGMYISFAGNVTFRGARSLREALRSVPLDRLLLETDSPFLTPHPHRGKQNDPGMVAYTYAVAAESRGCSVEELIHATAENLLRLFSTSRATGS